MSLCPACPSPPCAHTGCVLCSLICPTRRWLLFGGSCWIPGSWISGCCKLITSHFPTHARSPITWVSSSLCTTSEREAKRLLHALIELLVTLDLESNMSVLTYENSVALVIQKEPVLQKNHGRNTS